MPDNGDKIITPLDKLLAGLTAMTEKLDAISARVDAMERPAEPPPPPAPAKAVDKDTDDDMPTLLRRDADPDEVGDLPAMGRPAEPAADSLNAIRTRRAKLTEFQARADAVCGMFGTQAPPPLQGESVNGYARRMLRGWQKFSPDWKDHDLGTLDGKTLGVAASNILQAAADEARHPKVPNGHLMERKRSDGNGHFITEFFGSPSVWMNEFAGLRRYATRINTQPDNGYRPQ